MSFVDSLMDMLKTGKRKTVQQRPATTFPRPGTIRPWLLRCLTGITTTKMKFSSMPALRASL